MQPSEHYRAVRGQVAELVRDLTPEQQETRVPGCPAWTVRELVSHLSGLATDLANGRIEGAGSPPWTAVQVVDRQGTPISDLLTEWDTHAPVVESVMDDLGAAGVRIYFDAAMHEDDLREALGLPASTSPTHAAVLRGLVWSAGQRITKAGLPAMGLHAGGLDLVAGEGEPTASVTVSEAGELARVVAGRRSLSQIAAYDWQGDAAAYAVHLPMFAPGEAPV